MNSQEQILKTSAKALGIASTLLDYFLKVEPADEVNPIMISAAYPPVGCVDDSEDNDWMLVDSLELIPPLGVVSRRFPMQAYANHFAEK